MYEVPLIKNITNRSEPLVLVSGANVRSELKLDRASYIDLALLLGTDFSDRIKGVGPSWAFKFIKKHGSIERIIELEPKCILDVPVEVYLAQVELARSVFQTLPPIPTQVSLVQKERDEEKVTQIMHQCGLGDALMTYDGWDHTTALDGNYFQDDPHMW